MLCITIWHVSQLELDCTLRSFGIIKRNNAFKRLTKEKENLLILLEEIGVCPLRWKDPNFMSSCKNYSVDTAHMALSEAYQECASTAVYLGKPFIGHILSERSRIHKFHVKFFLV